MRRLRCPTLGFCTITALLVAGLALPAMADGTFRLIQCDQDADCMANPICEYPLEGDGSVCDPQVCGDLGVCVEDFGLLDGVDMNRYPCRFVGQAEPDPDLRCQSVEDCWSAFGLECPDGNCDFGLECLNSRCIGSYEVNCSLVVPDDPAYLRPEFVVEPLNWYGNDSGLGPQWGEVSSGDATYFPPRYPYHDRLGYASLGWERGRYLGDVVFAPTSVSRLEVPVDFARALRSGGGDLTMLLEGAPFDFVERLYATGASQTGGLMWRLAEHTAYFEDRVFDIYFPIVAGTLPRDFNDQVIVAFLSENDIDSWGAWLRGFIRSSVGEWSPTTRWYEFAGGSHSTSGGGVNPHPLLWPRIAGALIWKAIMGEELPPNAYLNDRPGWRAPWFGPFDQIDELERDGLLNTTGGLVHPEAAAAWGTFVGTWTYPGVFLGSLFGAFVDRTCDVPNHGAMTSAYNRHVNELTRDGYLSQWWAEIFFRGTAATSDIGMPHRCDCGSDADCPDGLYCAGDHCVTCLEDDHCLGWLFCEANRCVALIDAIAETYPPRDAGEVTLEVSIDYDGWYVAVPHGLYGSAGPPAGTSEGTIHAPPHTGFCSGSGTECLDDSGCPDGETCVTTRCTISGTRCAVDSDCETDGGTCQLPYEHTYTVPATEGTLMLEVDLTCDVPDLDMEVYGPDGEFLGGSYSGGSNEHVTAPTAVPGEYTVVVYRFSNLVDAPYKLTWSFLEDQAEDIWVEEPLREVVGGTIEEVVVGWDTDVLDPDGEYFAYITHHRIREVDGELEPLPEGFFDRLVRATKIILTP